MPPRPEQRELEESTAGELGRARVDFLLVNTLLQNTESIKLLEFRLFSSSHGDLTPVLPKPARPALSSGLSALSPSERMASWRLTSSRETSKLAFLSRGTLGSAGGMIPVAGPVLPIQGGLRHPRTLSPRCQFHPHPGRDDPECPRTLPNGSWGQTANRREGLPSVPLSSRQTTPALETSEARLARALG